VSTDPLARLTRLLKQLPGIGPKSAQRLALHLLRAPGEYVGELAGALHRVQERVRLCEVCCDVTEAPRCPICSDARRDDHTVCVVEQPTDVRVLERTGEFRGTYHVLHGALSPLDGVGPDELHIKELLARIRPEGDREVILASNPTVEGEATALYLSKLLKPPGVKVTRIAQGISVGSELEYTDGGTIARALQNRQEV